MRSSFFLIGVVLAAGLYFGSSFLIEKWQSVDLSLPDSVKGMINQLTPDASPNPTAVYKWQDAQGNWQYGDNPPANTDYQTVELQGVQTITMPTVQSVSSSTESSDTPDSSITPLTPFTDPGKIKQLVDDAKNVQKLSQERVEALEQQF